MQEMGILKLSENTHSVYCVYRNRIMIPIRDRYSHIEGFTARAIDDKSDCKYLNSADSDLYCKSVPSLESTLPSRKHGETESFT